MKTPAQTPIVFRDVTKVTALILIFLSVTAVHAQNFSQDNSAAVKTVDPAEVRRQALYYRNQGLELQNGGDLDGAMSAYTKAREIDPVYAAVYNDMGVIYEARGMYKQAEQNYLKAAEVDPAFASAYSNLALLKEEERDIEKASYYWKKRAEVGDPNDPWTLKAKEKIYNIGSPRYSFHNQASNIKSEFKEQSRFYREEGLKMQSMGNLNEALALYMKAQQLDPSFAVVYNDMGVIYEAQGKTKIAEEYYLKSIDIDPYLSSAYSNLALLYEGGRDLKRALVYWEKRQTMGSPADPWTSVAGQRVRDIRLVLGEAAEASEGDVISLVGDTLQNKELLRKDDKKLAKSYFDRAQDFYKNGDEVTALKKAVDAQQLDPKNDEIKQFVDQVKLRLLSK